MKLISMLNGIYDALLTLLFLVCLSLGGYVFYDTLQVYQGAAQRGTMIYDPAGEEAAPLGELSDACIAWLSLEGTNVNYPLMQGQDNLEFLNKDPYGEYSLSGSLFLDFRNDALFRDPYSLIYGHHMEGGAMFGALDAYLKRGFFEKHRSGTLTLRDGTRYPLHLFAAMDSDASDSVVFGIGDREELAARIYECAENLHELPENTRIVGLSTCKDAVSSERTVVFGWIDDAEAKGVRQ